MHRGWWGRTLMYNDKFHSYSLKLLKYCVFKVFFLLFTLYFSVASLPLNKDISRKEHNKLLISTDFPI